MSLPKVLYIARSDIGGGAEQRLSLTAKHYENTLAFYVKFNHHSWEKVKSFPIVFFDKIFGAINKQYYKYATERVNIKSRLSITENFNQTWSHLKKLPEFWACDIVHISNLHTNYFDLSALKEITKYKPVVLNVSDLWMLTGGEAYSPNDDGFKKGIATTNDKTLNPLNNPWIDRRQHMMNKKHQIFSQLKDSLFFMTNSKWTEQQFLASWIMRFGPDFRTIRPGVNTTIYKNKANRSWDKLRVLFFNSKNKFKNHELILNALSKINQPIDLYIIGNSVEHVFPFVTNKFIASYIYEPECLSDIFNEVDVLVYPSIAETFGMMVAEAKACGVCVIGTNGTAVEEQIIHQETGLLIEQNDENQLVHQINWCANNISEVRTIGNQATVDIQQHFTFEKYMDETIEYYKYIYAKTKK